MAKTLRTSGDYTIKTGAGSSGSNSIIFDSSVTRVKGNLVVDGSQTIVDSATLQVDDPIIVLSRNNSGTDIDSGVMINRAGIGNNAAIYWNEGDDVFKVVTTTSDGTGTSIVDTALSRLQVATPTSGSDAVTKSYADALVSGGAFFISFTGDDSTTVSVSSGNTVDIAGGSNINTSAAEPDTVTVNLNNDLTNITSITSDASNGDLELTANGTGAIVVNNVLTFDSAASDPVGTPATTKIYHKTVGGGDTGIYFKNPNDTVGELISKSKATALAIALG